MATIKPKGITKYTLNGSVFWKIRRSVTLKNFKKHLRRTLPDDIKTIITYE